MSIVPLLLLCLPVVAVAQNTYFVPDDYPNPNAWSGFYGYLDSSGDGQALLLISPGDVTAYIGTTFYWTVFPIDMSIGLPTTSTNAASFQVLP